MKRTIDYTWEQFEALPMEQKCACLAKPDGMPFCTLFAQQFDRARLDRLCGHGGIFKTRGVAQRFLAAAMRTPVSVLQTAGEGGPYGMALLAAYRRERAAGLTETLPAFLTRAVFASAPVSTLAPQPEEIEGFERFLARYRKALAVERSAVAQFPATAP